MLFKVFSGRIEEEAAAIREAEGLQPGEVTLADRRQRRAWPASENPSRRRTVGSMMETHRSPAAEDDRTAPLAGHVAIVTGGARGIGRAIARRLGREGARLVLLDRDAAGVLQTCAELAAAGNEVTADTVDVTDADGVARAIRSVSEREGRIDILVNNAGIYPHTPFEDVTLQEWRRVIASTLDGVFICSRTAYPMMRDRGYGRIINISSATFFIGYPEMTPYISGKGGIIGFTRALASEAGPQGITVNAITPGLIETEGSLEEDPTGELFEEIVGGQAIKRRGRPEDIAECVAYLASPAAGFITGQTINVDGGHRYH
jgi:NAD(P)-dependent dehydrogenase (short-subunit alcohol dehydrogenase family)